MIILSFYQWDVGLGGSCIVGVLVVDSFEFCSIYFICVYSIFKSSHLHYFLLVSSPCPTCSVIQTEVTKLRLNDTVANSAINSGVKVYSSTSKDKEASVLNDTKMQEKPISSSTNQISSSEDSSSSSTFDQLLKAPIELISRVCSCKTHA